MLPRFFDESLTIEEVGMSVNYGLNKVRFTAPVPVGSRLRGRLTLVSSDPIDNNGVQVVWDVVVEKEGSAKPVCIAQTVTRRYP
jgi:acyl dehydratase